MKGPTAIETPRLRLRPPGPADAEAIFERYASDPEVTRYVSFPRHQDLQATHAFIDWSRAQWKRWPAGPYLVLAKSDQRLLGGTGLNFETPTRAEVGYVLARDAWGKGVATETLVSMVELAANLGVLRLQATCHPDHQASQRVLEKCGFRVEATLHRYREFPNLEPGVPADVLSYLRLFEPRYLP